MRMKRLPVFDAPNPKPGIEVSLFFGHVFIGKWVNYTAAC